MERAPSLNISCFVFFDKSPWCSVFHLPKSVFYVCVCVCLWAREEESMRAVAFVYADSKVCLRALAEYTLVLDWLTLAGLWMCVCVCICIYSEKCLWKEGCFFQWRLQTSTWILSGFGSGSPCASCHYESVCLCACTCVVDGCNVYVSLDISQDAVYIAVNIFWYFIIYIRVEDVRYFVREGGSEWIWTFSHCTMWIRASVIVGITVCFVSRLRPFHWECEARSNLAKSVFHLSLKQTAAGELTPIYHQCEIPTTLIWS